MMGDSENILTVERNGSALRLMLNRPNRRNALSAELLSAATAHIRAACADESIRSITITGAPPAFCAGLDLDEVEERAAHPEGFDATGLIELLDTIDRCEKPTIAEVNGPAMAGGAAIVCVTDVAVMAQSAELGFPGIQRGLLAPLLIPYLVRTVGPLRAKQLLLTGTPIRAAECVALGIASDAVANGLLRERVHAYTELFERLPPTAIAATKRCFYAQQHPTAAEQLGGMGRIDSRIWIVA